MAPTTSSFRSMNSDTTNTNGCSYSDGPQYVGCQVQQRGWPTPQYMSGGKRKASRRRRKSRAKRAKRAGGVLGDAIVPFGLLAWQKSTQRKRKHSKGKSYRKKSYRRRR